MSASSTFRDVPISTLRRRHRRHRHHGRMFLYFGAIVAFALVLILKSNMGAPSSLSSSTVGADTTSSLNLFPNNPKAWALASAPAARSTNLTHIPVAGKQYYKPPGLGPIFYNLFIVSEQNENYNSSHMQQIIEEQMMERNMSAPSSTVLYTLIGNNAKKWVTTVNSLCGSQCQMREYLQEGDEVHTLQAMWNYCQIQDRSSSNVDSNSNNNDQYVTYLHDKGSFHSTDANEQARRLGTKAALECRSLMQLYPRKCNVCTSEFHVIPQYLGNSK
jgi:hypothetical protein